MNRNGEVSSRLAVPSANVGAVHSRSSAVFARLLARACSKNLVTMMYQLPSDMITSNTSTKRATKSPLAHRAPRPYGFATVADEAGSGGGAAVSVALADAVVPVSVATGGLTAAPPFEAVAGAEAACAKVACGANSAPAAPAVIIRLPARAARVRFFIKTPGAGRIDLIGKSEIG
jgi:hypothetical protein